MTDELHLFLAKNNKRVGGSVTVGISRLPVDLIMNLFHHGWTIQHVLEQYPSLKQGCGREGLRVIKKLTKEYDYVRSR